MKPRRHQPLIGGPGEGASHLALVAADHGASSRGVEVVAAAEPEAAAEDLAARLDADIAMSLQEGVDLLAARDAASRRHRLATRIAYAKRLSVELRGYDVAADDHLRSRVPELRAAKDLAPEVIHELPALEAVAAGVAELEVAAAEASAALASAEAAASVLAPDRGTSVESSTVRALGSAGAAARASRRRALAEMAAVERKQRDLATEEGAAFSIDVELDFARSEEAAARKQERRLLLQAAAVVLVALAIGLGAAAGAVSPVIAALLLLALLPPLVELLRRRWSLRQLASARVARAESQALAAERRRLAVADRLREQHESALEHLERAEATLVDVNFGWQSAVGGCSAPVADIAAALEAVAACRSEDFWAARRLAAARSTLAATLARSGVVPSDDPMVDLQQLRRLAALQPTAFEHLEAAAAADRRAVDRDVLASLLGSRSLTALQRSLRAMPEGDDRPLVIVDDGDAEAFAAVKEALLRLGEAAGVKVVTSSPERWRDEGRPADDEAGRPSSAGDAGDPLPVPPPEDDRSWFV